MTRLARMRVVLERLPRVAAGAREAAIAALAAECRCSPEAIRRDIRDLREAGFPIDEPVIRAA